MGFTKKKKIHKHLLFYKMAHGYHPPYKVVIDPESVALALKFKVPIENIIPNMLAAKTKLVTTPCIQELYNQIGGEVAQFAETHLTKVDGCDHPTKLSFAECVYSVIEKKRFFVVTQDRELRAKLKTPPYVAPAMYFAFNQITLEAPTFKEKKKNKEDVKKMQTLMPSVEQKRLKEIKDAEKVAKEERKKKRKKKGNPHPLSVLKSKKQVIPPPPKKEKPKKKTKPQATNTTSNNDSEPKPQKRPRENESNESNSNNNESEEPKRKRIRKHKKKTEAVTK